MRLRLEDLRSATARADNPVQTDTRGNNVSVVRQR